MIIDIHNHIGEPWGTTYRQSTDELLSRMDRAGIDMAVVFPFPFGNFDNDYVAEAVRTHPDRLIGSVLISPFQRDNLRDYVRQYTEQPGYRAIKLHPAAHGYKLSEFGVTRPIFELCREFHLPIIAYSGDEVYATPFQMMVAAQEYPDLIFIMTHSGFMMGTNDAVMTAERCPNVFLEHSSAISLGIRQSIDAVGADRVLLGSDTPYMDYEVEVYKIEITVDDPAERAAVLGGNAAHLLNLTVRGTA